MRNRNDVAAPNRAQALIGCETRRGHWNAGGAPNGGAHIDQHGTGTPANDISGDRWRGGKKGDVKAGEIGSAFKFGNWTIFFADSYGLGCAVLGSEEHDLGRGKIALGEQLGDLAAGHARRADYGNPEVAARRRVNHVSDSWLSMRSRTSRPIALHPTSLAPEAPVWISLVR